MACFKRFFLFTLIRAIMRLFWQRRELSECNQRIECLTKELNRSQDGARILAYAVREGFRPIRTELEAKHSAVIAGLLGQLDIGVAARMMLAREVVAKNSEIETLAAENMKFREAAMIEPLTGLYNRRGADHELNRAFSAFERRDRDSSQQPVIHQLSILAMDLDNFKLVNDTFGHAVGDEVLTTVAGHLKQAFRADDIIVRPGGDEFTVYLINAPKNGAIHRAGHLIELMNADQRLRFGEIAISISIGISHGSFSTKRGGLQIVKQVEALADTAMYRAKRKDDVPYCITVAEDAVSSDTVLGDL